MNQFKFGVEYTFVPTAETQQKIKEHARDRGWGGTGYISRDADLLSQALRSWKAHEDNGALEIPSKPCVGIKQHLAWFERLRKAADGLGYVPRRVDVAPDGTPTYHGTGGGHIHVELPKDPAAVLRYMRRAIAFFLEHPQFFWFMNEYMDDENAMSLQHAPDTANYLDRIRRFAYHGEVTAGEKPSPLGCFVRQYRRVSLRTLRADIYFLDSKMSAVRYAGETIEFRFFDAPRTVEQAEDHILLAQALNRFLLSTRSCKIDNVTNFSGVQPHSKEWRKLASNEQQMRADWDRLISSLGLSPTRYVKYVENYLDRKAHGVLN